jgi:arylsulfatase A-like enzyme
MRVIVFALHGCPAGWLGAYGNDWVGTPNLDRLAAEGVTFDRHISDCPEPTAARRAWAGGTLPFGSRLTTDTHTILVRANHPDASEWFYAGWGEVFDARPKPEDASPLEELLRAFPTILDRLADKPNFLLWIETDRLIPPWDVQQDVFEAYLADMEDEEPLVDDDEETEDAENDEEEPEDDEEAAGVEFVDDAEEVEEAEEPEPVDASPPEEPVTPFADPPTGPFDRSDLDAWDWLHRTFAAVITKLDAELGLLFDDLRKRGLDQSAAWLITSDFGHPLGEHGQIGLHRPWLHEELVHLPLLLRLPGAEQAGRRVAGFTQPPDVYPTLLALLGSAPSEGKGFNLLPLARGEGQSARECAVTALEFGDAAEIALRTDEWALLVPTKTPEGDPPREPLLFEKPDDRWEVNDLRPRNIERADELEAQLREVVQETGTNHRGTEAQRKQERTDSS